MKREKNTIEYYKGVVDAIIERLFEEEISMNEDKHFSYFVKPYKDGFKVVFEWCIGYNEAQFRGNNFSPADDDEPIYESQEYYFTLNEKTLKVIKEVTDQVWYIHDLPSPELQSSGEIEDDYDVWVDNN